VEDIYRLFIIVYRGEEDECGQGNDEVSSGLGKMEKSSD
jgi:hypothetical protein